MLAEGVEMLTSVFETWPDVPPDLCCPFSIKLHKNKVNGKRMICQIPHVFYVVSGNMCGCGGGCQSASVRVKTHLVSCI